MERKVNPLFLDKGMFITRLSRPWIDTPFWIQGFIVTSDAELDALRKYSDYAYIDTLRGIEAEFYMEEDMQLRTNKQLEQDLLDKRINERHPQQTSVKQELPEAIKFIEGSVAKLARLISGISETHSVDMKLVDELVDPLIDSIIRQPDTMVLLANLRNRHGYFRSHAINSCIFACAYGRFLGISKAQLKKLVTGVLLLDVGNTQVPAEILNKNGALTDDEFREIHKHVYHSVKILKEIKGIDEDIVNIALTHHERFDGSGYPNALSGLMVPVYGRIASIIDCFDAMIRQRSHADMLTPHAAMQHIFSWRGKLFQPELVDYFMQALGTYPTGSLVELNSGEIGLVIAQNPTQRLRPLIVPLKQKDGSWCNEFIALDLSRKTNAKQGKPKSIIRDVQPQERGINTDDIYMMLNEIIPNGTSQASRPRFSIKSLLAWTKKA